MVRRLIEADYQGRARNPPRSHVTFWLREALTSRMLVALCQRYGATARRLALRRPALRSALRGDVPGTERALRVEQEHAREADREYWKPLRAELTRWRRTVPRQAEP